MSDLTSEELSHVSGAGNKCCSPCDPDPCHGKDKEKKGNNGYGNGGRDGVPGKSGKQDCTR